MIFFQNLKVISHSYMTLIPWLEPFTIANSKRGHRGVVFEEL